MVVVKEDKDKKFKIWSESPVRKVTDFDERHKHGMARSECTQLHTYLSGDSKFDRTYMKVKCVHLVDANHRQGNPHYIANIVTVEEMESLTKLEKLNPSDLGREKDKEFAELVLKQSKRQSRQHGVLLATAILAGLGLAGLGVNETVKYNKKMRDLAEKEGAEDEVGGGWFVGSANAGMKQARAEPGAKPGEEPGPGPGEEPGPGPGEEPEPGAGPGAEPGEEPGPGPGAEADKKTEKETETEKETKTDEKTDKETETEKETKTDRWNRRQFKADEKTDKETKKETESKSGQGVDDDKEHKFEFVKTTEVKVDDNFDVKIYLGLNNKPGKNAKYDEIIKCIPWEFNKDDDNKNLFTSAMAKLKERNEKNAGKYRDVVAFKIADRRYNIVFLMTKTVLDTFGESDPIEGKLPYIVKAREAVKKKWHKRFKDSCWRLDGRSPGYGWCSPGQDQIRSFYQCK